MYQRGARAFWIHNTGPIGCLPAAIFYIQNPKPGFLDKYGCIKAQNNMAIEFNRQLKTQVTKLRRELPRAALIYVDIYSAKYHLIRKAEYYGQSFSEIVNWRKKRKKEETKEEDMIFVSLQLQH